MPSGAVFSPPLELSIAAQAGDHLVYPGIRRASSRRFDRAESCREFRNTDALGGLRSLLEPFDAGQQIVNPRVGAGAAFLASAALEGFDTGIEVAAIRGARRVGRLGFEIRQPRQYAVYASVGLGAADSGFEIIQLLLEFAVVAIGGFRGRLGF